MKQSLDPSFVDERLIPPELDNYEMYIFAVLGQLSRDRPIAMQGYAPIPLSAFDNYIRLFQDPLNIDEILLLQTLDSVYRRTASELIN